MIKTTPFIFFYIIASFVLCVNAVPPTITSLSRVWGKINADLTITGSNFGSSTPPVWVNNVQGTSTASSTSAVFTMFGTSPDKTYNIQVSNPANEKSNTLTYYYADIVDFYQNNKIFYMLGDFEMIPDKTILRMKPNSGTTFYPITYINNTHLSLPMVEELNGDIIWVNFVNYYGNDPYGGGAVSFSPVVSAYYFTVDGLAITGFKYIPNTVIQMEDSVNCELLSQTIYGMQCAPPPLSLANPVTQFIVQYPTGKKTSIPISFTPLTGFNNIADNKTVLSVTNFDTSALSIKINGLSATPITSSLTKSNEITFTYPINAQCGYTFVSSGVSRITNNLLVCPNPVFDSISKPFESSLQLIVRGYFMNPIIYNIGVGGVSYNYQYDDGVEVPSDCIQNMIFDPSDSSYTFTCTLPDLRPFNFIAKTLTGYTNVFYFGYYPIITSATSTNYLFQGVVTITGSRFTNFDLSTSIGGAPCTSPAVVANTGSTKITCVFESNVLVSNFKQPLPVTVSTRNGFESTAAVFRYNRPDPIISSVTSANYGTPSGITISGLYLFSDVLYISIGGVECELLTVNAEGTKILCNFPSTASPNGYTAPLQVHVSVEHTYNTTAPLFYYLRPIPVVTGSTSTTYGIAGVITVFGNYFTPPPPTSLQVIIGGTQCASPTVVSETMIACVFSSNVVVSNFKTPLPVTVTIDSRYTTSNSVFYYIRPNPVVSSATPTKYLSAGQVTITGKYFSYPDSLSVTIGA
ncbi:hypothetical protein CYY_010492, partial [Polysphondylium violaceum]